MVSSCGGEWAAQMPGIKLVFTLYCFVVAIFLLHSFGCNWIYRFVRGRCDRNRQAINHYSTSNEWKLIYYAAAIAFRNIEKLYYTLFANYVFAYHQKIIAIGIGCGRREGCAWKDVVHGLNLNDIAPWADPGIVWCFCLCLPEFWICGARGRR